MVSWGSDPQRKIEVGATEISADIVTATVTRVENGISRCSLIANDYQAKNYIANLDILDSANPLKVSLRYGSGAWIQVFEGIIEKVGPILIGGQGGQQTVEALAYGYGRAARNTHCAVDYGLESNTGISTPHTIWDDIIDNRILKNFDGAATGYAPLAKSVAALTNPVINFLQGNYRNNIDLINDIAKIYLAYARQLDTPLAGVHWFVDETPEIFIDTIGNHEFNAAGWPTYWGGGGAVTLTEGVDFIQSSFRKDAMSFANKIILYCDLRKPGYDYLCEHNAATIWTNDVDYPLTSISNSDDHVVGDHSLDLRIVNAAGAAVWPGGSLLTGDAAAAQKDVAVTDGTKFYVSESVNLYEAGGAIHEEAIIASIAGNTLTMQANLTNTYHVADSAIAWKLAKWDTSKLGSPKSPPTINFYAKKDDELSEPTTAIYLWTTAPHHDFYYGLFMDWGSHPDNEWIHFSVPFGPYFKGADEPRYVQWVASGGIEDWTEINGVAIRPMSDPLGDTDFLVDDFNISGKIIREAYDSTSIALYKEHQKIVRYDCAVDDEMAPYAAGPPVNRHDRGTAARLAYAELLAASTVPLTGIIVTPFAIDVLPGQIIHVHSDYTGAAYRVDQNMRVKEITHTLAPNIAPTTNWDLTDDLTNTFAIGFNQLLSTLYQVVFTDPEAKNLKSTGLDTAVNRLSVDYG